MKTHRSAGNGFNAMFAVTSVEAAKLYYQEFKNQQSGKENPLKLRPSSPTPLMKNKQRKGTLSMKPSHRKI